MDVVTPLCSFAHPEPAGRRPGVFPVFLPFAGCKSRCLFCAQDVQTGKAHESLSATLAQAAEELERRVERAAPPIELAFYGGTFTALPKEEQRVCLAFADIWRKRGCVNGIRCSTRPDAVDEDALSLLRDSGVSLVELGVQSFSDAALAASGRGYDGRTAAEGCERVVRRGFSLGIQLMPGMPGLEEQAARQDILTAAGFAPEAMRLYPCLVLRGTGLEALWRDGAFTPWTLDRTVSFLADACLTVWEKGIPIIRMGLAGERGLEENILAGPWHPALGSMARGLALARYMAKKIAALALENPSSRDFLRGARPLRLLAPRQYQGEFWGHKNALTAFYAALGIDPARVEWVDGDTFIVQGAEIYGE